MTAVGETDSSLATQCLDFCQALAHQGKDFKLTKKRKSPSTLKRNAKRREEFLSKKSIPVSFAATGLEYNQKQCEAFQCAQCNSSFKTVNGLKIH